MTSPWAAPGIPLKAIKWLFMKYRPLFIWPVLDPKMWSWGVKMLANCNSASYARNKGRMVRISNYSRDALIDLLAEEDIAFDGRAQGTLQLFRTEKQVKGSKADQAVLDAYDSPYEVLDRDGCIEIEPGLAAGSQAPHRSIVIRAGGVVIVDDSYNASPGSVRAALELLAGIPGRHVAVLGEMRELGAAHDAGHRDVEEFHVAFGQSVVDDLP